MELVNEDQLSDESFHESFDQATAHALSRWLEELTENPRATLAHTRAERLAFEHRLSARWGKALDLFELVLLLANEAGVSSHERKREKATETNDLTFDVIQRLHARACQIAAEILTLLEAGHATGAHARWRTLHEVVVVAYFVKQHGHETAERYHLHGAIDSYKAATEYERFSSTLGIEPLDISEIESLRRTRDELVQRFGKDFNEQYGWAANVIGGRVNFAQIEAHVGLEHFRVYYKMASHGVHANPKGMLWQLGNLDDRDIILAGPTNAGLADPGHGALISLFQITTLIANFDPDLEDVLTIQAIQKLEELAGSAFQEIHQRQVSEEESKASIEPSNSRDQTESD